MIKKEIIFFGKECILECDGRCDLVEGRNKGMIISEGGHIKPTKDSEKLNKWCAREYERSDISERTSLKNRIDRHDNTIVGMHNDMNIIKSTLKDFLYYYHNKGINWSYKPGENKQSDIMKMIKKLDNK